MFPDHNSNGHNTILLDLAKVFDAEIQSKQSYLENTMPEDFCFTIHDEDYRWDWKLKELVSVFVDRYRRGEWRGEIYLAREFEGEEVQVMVKMPRFDLGQQYVELVVRILKGMRENSTFNVWAAEEITVESMNVKVPSHDEFYDDPTYYAVDEDSDLQRGLREYLKIRGIDKSTTDFLYEYMLRKSKRQPITVLKDVQKFLKN